MVKARALLASTAACALVSALAGPGVAVERDTRGAMRDFEHKTIVYVVGDSIALHVGGPTSKTHLTYPERAERLLQVPVYVVAHGAQCVVATVCGYPYPLVQTFRSEVLGAIPKPTDVIIALGINDLSHATTSGIRRAYRDMIALGANAGVRVSIATLTPQGEGLSWPIELTQAQRNRLNRWIAQQPEYVDFATTLGGDYLDPKFNGGDGLHPDPLGIEAMAREMARFIRTQSSWSAKRRPNIPTVGKVDRYERHGTWSSQNSR